MAEQLKVLDPTDKIQEVLCEAQDPAFDDISIMLQKKLGLLISFPAFTADSLTDLIALEAL
ncbi:MAG: hypothetical protein ACJA0S_000792 [Rickettsiales bacterium]|jgi:hypothetical protein